MIESPRALYHLAQFSPTAAKAMLAIRSLVRHPVSPSKRRAAYNRSSESLDGDLMIGRWIHRLRVLPEDTCAKLPVAAPIDGSRTVGKMKIGVVCHLYHTDVIEEIAEYLSNLPPYFDLFVSTDTEEKKSEIERLRSVPRIQNLVIRVVPNVGRDIAPKLITFNDLGINYDLLLYIHGKKSSFESNLSGWRRHLLGSLLGSEAIVHSIISAFAEIPELGMLAPQHYYKLRGLGWTDNKKMVAALCGRMLQDNFRFGCLDFPSGSMFWCRPRALRSLWDLNLTIDDFPAETGQINGTIAHAIERLFFVSCEVEGLRWLKITDDRASVLSGHVVDIQSTAELRKLVTSPGRHLLVRRNGI